jgi:signal transduction histidine kinase
VGKHQQILHPPEEVEGEFSRTFKEHLKEKEGQALEAQVLTKNGEKRDVSIKANVFVLKGKNVLQGTFRDITDHKRAEEERKELEAQLQQAQKMEAIGVLAGGIAHNFNNLLMAIQGNVSLMLFDIDSTHPHYEFLTTIKDDIKDGAQLARQLLGYARKGKYFPEPINLNELVETISGAIGGTRRDIHIHRELVEDLYAIEADQSQIEQVLMNLFLNAADAMPGGGDLILKTANATDTDMGGQAYDVKPGNYVQFTVTDTGRGMDKETQERIFEPFFTTKEMGRGTGLGLASVYGIIKGHAGYIDVDSGPGRGTTFTIYLPATDEEVEKTIEPAQQMVKGNGTILLVDDEDRVIDVGTKVLKKLGYTVLEARSGKEAIEIYKENKDKIALVLLDMVMPHMGGGEAYDKMKEINPKVKVLLSSGYDIDSEAKEILARGCDAFIQKPYGMQGLSVRIREILDKK